MKIFKDFSLQCQHGETCRGCGYNIKMVTKEDLIMLSIPFWLSLGSSVGPL